MAPTFNGRLFADNNLINGRMNFECSGTASCTDHAGLSKFRFQSGKAHRLRFINTGSEGTQRISIDGHNMTVMANDFTEIELYDTQILTLGVGQRADVIVHAHDDDPKGAYWLRAEMPLCSSALQPLALAAIHYEDTNENTVPKSSAWPIPPDNTCSNAPLTETKPYYSMELQEPSYTETLTINGTRNATGNLLWPFGVS